MKIFFAITVATLKMLFRNRQTVFFTWFLPLILMLVIGYVSDAGTGGFRVGIARTSESSAVTMLADTLKKIEGVEVSEGTQDAEKAELANNKRDLVIELPEGFSLVPMPSAGSGGSEGTADQPAAILPPQQVVLYENQANPAASGVAAMVVEQIFQQAQLQASGVPPTIAVERRKLEAQAFRYVDFLVPGIIAMTIMQLGIFGTAFAIVDAKQKGVLRRVMATPVRGWQFVLGNMVARLVLSLMQSGILVVVAILVFHVEFKNWWWLIGLILLGNIVFLSLGLFVSGIAKTVETVPFIANLIAFPMMLLGGIFFPTSSFPDWLRRIVDLLPIAPLADLMRDMVTLGKPFSEGLPKLLLLCAWAVIGAIIASLAFKLQERD